MRLKDFEELVAVDCWELIEGFVIAEDCFGVGFAEVTVEGLGVAAGNFGYLGVAHFLQTNWQN